MLIFFLIIISNPTIEVFIKNFCDISNCLHLNVAERFPLLACLYRSNLVVGCLLAWVQQAINLHRQYYWHKQAIRNQVIIPLQWSVGIIVPVIIPNLSSHGKYYGRFTHEKCARYLLNM